MKDATETLLMFAQLLAVEPSILPPDALHAAENLASELEQLRETEMNRAADLIITWMGEFPKEQTVFAQANRELKGISEPGEVTWTFPNLQIIEEEETETTVIITPGFQTEKISLFSYLKQTLNQWIQKNQNNQ